MSLSSPTAERTIYDVQGDLDLDDLLKDAVPPPACEWKDDDDAAPCGEPATWIMSNSCGHSYYWDDEHGALMMGQARLTKPGAKVFCDNPAPPRHRPMIEIQIRFDRIMP